MIIKSIPIQLTLPESSVPRSKGVHVSGIIRCIAQETGILSADDAEELSLQDVRTITDPVALLRISIGLAWEAWYIPQMLSKEGVVDHPGEMQLDGIYMSPDGESLDVIITPHNKGQNRLWPRIHEVKATYKSTNTVGDLSGQWMWLTQLMAYCKGAKTRYAKMHVLFLDGDYKWPMTPQLKCWELEFTQKEIDDRWDMLKSYRDWKEE